MWRFKRWRTDGWAELIRLLITKKIQVVLTGSNSQQDQDINKEIRKKIASESENVSTRQLLDLSGKLRLSHTTTLLQGAIGYIGVDTSITHLAASCGTKTLAIFGATPPTNFGPWPRVFQGQQPWKTVGASEASGLRVQTLDNVRIIQGPGTCVPCRKSGCLNKFDSHSDCLENLTAEHLAPLVLTHFNLDAHSS
jgi:heptosyltransferase-3